MRLAALIRSVAAGLLLVGAPAVAAPPDPSARLAECELLAGVLAGKKPPKLEHVGKDGEHDVWHVVVSSNKRWLAFLASDGADADDPACAAYPVGRTKVYADGDLVAGNGEDERAYFLSDPKCEGDCPLVGAVRAKAERPLAARRFAASCDEGAEVETVRLFSDAESLVLRCREGGGAGFWRETLMILHVRDGQLRTLFSGDMGFHEEPTRDELRDGACPAEPAGWMRVISVSSMPTMDVLEAKSDDMVDGAGSAQVFRWMWDPTVGAFARSGSPRVERFDMRRACRKP